MANDQLVLPFGPLLGSKFSALMPLVTGIWKKNLFCHDCRSLFETSPFDPSPGCDASLAPAAFASAMSIAKRSPAFSGLYSCAATIAEA
jgi:hypothetical protein